MIFCQGYCLTDMPFSWTKEDNPPEFIPSVTLEEASKEGWKFVTHPKFRYCGEGAYLCPKCVKQWKLEKQMCIEGIINSAKEVKTLRQYRDGLIALTKFEASNSERNQFVEVALSNNLI